MARRVTQKQLDWLFLDFMEAEAMRKNFEAKARFAAIRFDRAMKDMLGSLAREECAKVMKRLPKKKRRK